ncbi:hypothetical protein OROMI_000929 [Orobanche minor]
MEGELPYGSAEKKKLSIKWGEFGQELKRVSYIAAPMVAVAVLQSCTSCDNCDGRTPWSNQTIRHRNRYFFN